MPVQEIQAKSILRHHKHIDSWFVSGAGMNLYRGCSHNCIYCDGRAESYYVEGDFGHDIGVKINAREILDKELNPSGKRSHFEPGFVLLGGGVNDSYQPVEQKYELSKKALELLLKYKHPVHILTKSTLVLRDLELISAINQQRKAIVSFSFSSTDNKIGSIVEPGASSATQRLEAIETLRKNGIACGVFLMPLIPFISDKGSILRQTMTDITNAGANFVIYGGMTLKAGRQNDYFMKHMQVHYPDKIEKYEQLYSNSGKYGSASPVYYDALHQRFAEIANEYKMPLRIPASLYAETLTPLQRLYVMLDQIGYFQSFKGIKNRWGKLSREIVHLSSFENLSLSLDEKQVIEEINRTGTCTLYEQLLTK